MGNNYQEGDWEYTERGHNLNLRLKRGGGGNVWNYSVLKKGVVIRESSHFIQEGDE